MNISDLISKLRQAQVTPRLLEGKLEIIAPKDKIDEKLLREIRSRKEELVAFLENAQRQMASYALIQAMEEQDFYTVSHGQKRLWILDRFENEQIAYNTRSSYAITGRLDRLVLEKVVRKVIERHEILRTNYLFIGGEVKQRVHQTAGDFTIAYMDLQGIPGREQQVKTLVENETQRSFDLSRGPLMRISLFQLEEEAFMLLIVLHHIITDAWSMAVLINEMISLYNCYVENLADELPPLSIQYKDYAAWQNDQLQGENMGKHSAYWWNQFKEPPPSLDLATDFPRPSTKTFRGDSLAFEISQPLTQAIVQLGQEQEATLFMTLLTAVYLLLYKYTQQRDLVIGTTTAGREQYDLENQLGFYVNTLPLRVAVEANDSFRKLSGKVKESAINAYIHQGYPFDCLIDRLQLNRDASRSPLFDVLVELVNTEIGTHGDQQAKGITVGPFETQTVVTQYDLSFKFRELNGTIYGILEFNTDLFDKNRVEYMKQHFLAVLEKAVTSTDEDIDSLAIVTDAEKQFLFNLNHRNQELPPKTFIELFEEQAAAFPEACAVQYRGDKLTYAQLNDQANLLARYLQATYKLQPGTCVGIMADRSPEVLIALLGIWKAGACFVPVDPANPPARKSFLLKDAAVGLLLTGSEKLLDLPDYYQGNVGLLDLEMPERIPTGSHAPTAVRLEDTAYVLYTSGSTGQPKGVQVSHGNLINYLSWANDYYFQQQTGFTFGWITPLGFDLTMTSVFSTLLRGDCLWIADEKPAPALLEEVCGEASPVNVLKLTPSHVALLSHLPIKKCIIEKIILGGEAVKPSHIEILRQLNPLMQIYNEYGPTETTIGSTSVELDSHGGMITIGRPIWNTSVFIVNENLQLQPLGIPGEICISGRGVSKGYVNRPSLNDGRFVGNPFEPGTKLYRTGDRGRWLPDGRLLYLGREDGQVKVKGYRIETQEIEYCLLKHQKIREAVVSVRKNTAEADSELVAFVVLSQLVETDELNLFLADHLPVYMLPAHYIQLSAIPLTANGKVDWLHLLEPSGPPVGGRPLERYTAPSTGKEKQLAEIWQGVLEKEPIGVDENFFVMGGDSIKAIRVVSLFNALEDQYALEVKELFEYQTIKKLAAYLDASAGTSKAEEARAEAALNLEALKSRILADQTYSRSLPEDWEDFYPMSEIEKGMLFHNLMDGSDGVYHDQFYYEIEDPDFNDGLFKRAFGLLVAKHEILRTSFQLTGFPEPLQVVHQSVGRLPVEFGDLRGVPRETQRKYFQEYMAKDMQQPFQLEQPGLWRMRVYRISDRHYSILWIFHHLIMDGWSQASMFTELSNTYFTLKEDPAFLPAKLKTSYKDYLIDQAVVFASASVRQYWQSQLQGFERTPLPLSRRIDQQHRSRKLAMSLLRIEADTTRQLLALSAASQISLKHLCLTAYCYLISQTTNRQDLTIGLVTNGRPSRQDADQMLGCFLNTVPLRLTLPKKVTGWQLAELVNQQANQVKVYDKLPLGEIAKLAGQEKEGDNPLFDIVFSYNDFHIYDHRHASTVLSQEPLLESFENSNTAFDFILSYEYGQLVILFSYLESIYSEQEAARLGQHYLRIIRQLAGEPFRELDASQLLDPTEREWLLNCGQGARPVAPAELMELFDKQVASRPTAVALRMGTRELTYRQLQQQADQLAYQLGTELGVMAGDRVGLLTPRTPFAVVGLLGILKAGAAFVPIEVDFPAERKRYILSDAAVSVLLIDSSQMFQVGEIYDGPVFVLDMQLSADGREELPERTNYPASAKDLAYVLYTSGSTGKPKGVAVERGSLLNYLQWANGYYFADGDSYPMPFFTSLGFDLTLTSVLSTLLRGDTLVIYPDMDAPELLTDIFGPDSPVKAVKLTPSHLSLLSMLSLTTTPVECVIAGGEALRAEQVSWLADFKPGLRLYNEYGPTEATVGCTVKRVLEPDQASSIGSPISGVHIRILGEQQQLLAGGVVGEIWIGGSALARGYLNQAELTASRFVSMHGERFYQTGDQGKWLASGEIEFLGRKDQQLKLRGYRIEPEEIRQTLLKVASLQEVIVSASSKNNQYLVAYYVSSEPLETEDLRDFLKEYLPAYMIPAYFIPLKHLPLTANGKIDYRALPLPEQEASGGEKTGYAAPVTELESRLVAIWEQVLSRKKISTRDVLFEIGGDSLKIVQIASRIQKELGRKVELRSIVSNPSIFQLANYLSQHFLADHEEIRPIGKSLPYYEVSHAQRRLWFIHKITGGSSAYNITLQYELRGEVTREAINKTFELILRRHEILRTVFIEVDGQPKQVIRDYDALDFEVEWVALDAGERAQLSALVQEQSESRFSLETGPLLKVKVVRLENQTHVLMLTVHHITMDGWSLNVLGKEFLHLLHSYSAGTTAPMPPLKIQYKDFVLWQNNLFAQVGEHLRTYWREKLAHVSQALRLPTDFPRPKVMTYQGDEVHFWLSQEASSALKSLGQANHVTLFTVLLSLVKVLLHRQYGEEDIVVGTQIAGRTRHELEDQIGLYVNTLVLYDRITGEDTFEEVLMKVSSTLLEAQSHSLYPFDRLVSELHLGSNLSRHPVFDVEVEMLDLDQEEIRVAEEKTNIAFRRLPLAVNRSKLDLAFLFTNDQSVGVGIEYNTDLFKRETIALLRNRFEKLLEVVLVHPGQKIATLDLRLDYEQEKIKQLAKVTNLDEAF